MSVKKKKDDSTTYRSSMYRLRMSAAGHSVRQAMIYFVLGCLWILISDHIKVVQIGVAF